MATEEVTTTVYDDDGVTVIEQFTSTRTIDLRTRNSHAINDKIDSGLPVAEQHLADIDAELAAWSGYNNSQIAASLGNEVIPALRFSVRALILLAKHIRGHLDDAGPT